MQRGTELLPLVDTMHKCARQQPTEQSPCEAEKKLPGRPLITFLSGVDGTVTVRSKAKLRGWVGMGR